MVKSLEKDAAGVLLPFKTKNYKYNIIRPGQPMGIKRWMEYEKLSVVVGFGKTFEAITTTLAELEKLLGSDRAFADIRVESILIANGLRKSIVEMSRERFNYAMYLASVFIVREGDDPLTWDIEKATEYIQDWTTEGLNEQDFFSFALLTVHGFKAHYSELKKEAEAQAEKLSALGLWITGKGKNTGKS